LPLRREEIYLNAVSFATATCPFGLFKSNPKGWRQVEICLNAVAYQQLQRVKKKGEGDKSSMTVPDFSQYRNLCEIQK